MDQPIKTGSDGNISIATRPMRPMPIQAIEAVEATETIQKSKTFLQECKEARDSVYPNRLVKLKKQILEHYTTSRNPFYMDTPDFDYCHYILNMLILEGFSVSMSEKLVFCRNADNKVLRLCIKLPGMA